MKKILSLLVCVLMGAVTASAVTIETDLTSQFASLTDWQNWQGATGYTSTNYCPMVEVGGGIGMKQVCEKYESITSITGIVFQQTVTGLSEGTYTIELYGGAAYTFGRGFESKLFSGGTYKDGDHIDTNTGIYLFASANGKEYKLEIPAYYACNFPNGASVVTLQNIVVGSDGNVTIGLTKEKDATNWHVIQLKSVIATVDGEATLAQLKTQAKNLLENETYKNVVGVERVNLQAAYETKPAAETAEAYKAAIATVGSAVAAFQSCDYTAYDNLVVEIAKAKALGMDETTVNSYAATSESTAATAFTNIQGLKVAEYNYVITSYSYSAEMGVWTTVNATARSGSHWDGTSTSTYNEQDQGWGGTSWECSYSQDMTLPAGDYIFKVAGRRSSANNSVLTMTVKKGDEVMGTVNDFPATYTGMGINKNGAASFDAADPAGFATGAAENSGAGWEWRYVKFTLSETATVNVAITASANALNQWVGFCNATVQSTTFLTAYHLALGSAKTTLANQSYVNIIGSERTALEEAIKIDDTLDKTNMTAVNEAVAKLKTATANFTAVKATYDNWYQLKTAEHPKMQYGNDEDYAALENCKSQVPASAENAFVYASQIMAQYASYVDGHCELATVSDAMDKTSTIVSPNFAEDYTFDVSETGEKGKWTAALSAGTTQMLKSQVPTDGELIEYPYLDFYTGTEDLDQDVRQIIELPAGHYMLSAYLRSSSIGKFRIYAGDQEQAVNVSGASGGAFGNGWNAYCVEFNMTEQGDIMIGAKTIGETATNWWGAARFRLFQFPGEPTAIEGVKTVGENNDMIYNLNGQRVAQPTKGLYIVNGKKCIMK